MQEQSNEPDPMKTQYNELDAGQSNEQHHSGDTS